MIHHPWRNALLDDKLRGKVKICSRSVDRPMRAPCESPRIKCKHQRTARNIGVVQERNAPRVNVSDSIVVAGRQETETRVHTDA